MKLISLLLYFNLVLLADVNPFVVFNAKHIRIPQTIIPLPLTQVVSKNKAGNKYHFISDDLNCTILIKPNESLFIVPVDKIDNNFVAKVSLDGRLSEKYTLVKNENKDYVIYNENSQILSVTLSSKVNVKVFFLYHIKYFSVK
ncbi:MAG: hypothetical protein Q9M39_07960 [Sulfurovum sp.]|nr:hypothetical protein [Sulfurovum sp.]